MTKILALELKRLSILLADVAALQALQQLNSQIRPRIQGYYAEYRQQEARPTLRCPRC